jgi:hypothetical protein
MKKKRILLGSILAVVILIFLSFNNVVGIRNNNSNLVQRSPLFDIRTKKALEQDENPYFNDYIGKGEKTKIYFPEKDNEKYLFCKYIDIVSQMDDKSFNKLVNNIITHQNQDDNSLKCNARKIILTLNFLRNNPKMVQNNINIEKNENSRAQFTSWCTLDGMWLPGCYLMEILNLIVGIVAGIIFFISFIHPECIFYTYAPIFCN